MYNQQKNLSVDDVFGYIARQSSAKKAIEEFNLKESFVKIRKNLNNYVHSNGRKYYNESYEMLRLKQTIKEKCEDLLKEIIFITVSFLLVLTMIKPMLIMSSDYTDYADM